MEIVSVVNPRWSTEDHSSIDVDITVDFGGPFPFTATPTDTVEYSRTIFADAVAGKYGVIAEYIP